MQNTDNQENAKKQALASKQLGGVRTATEAARMVRDRQLDADRQRGIASVHGQRQKADEALMAEKAKEAQAFQQRQAQSHQRVSTNSTHSLHTFDACVFDKSVCTSVCASDNSCEWPC